MEDLVLSVSDFVALLNQTLEYAYPNVTIVGELSNFRVSKNRWVYFDLKDESSSVKFFGTVYQLPGPLEDGLMMQVRGVPRLHNLFGFSVNVQSMSPVGEGSIKKAAALLEAKLRTEGLFDPDRKRTLPYPPSSIGLVASVESAAYHDFIKIINNRWSGVEIQLANVQVQGQPAPEQIVAAIGYFNTHAQPVDVLVLTRGGGSADDLAAFSAESVTRAVAGSRIPTLVAIGHEVDISLAELAADQRASTPSNAAELLVPDKKDEIKIITQLRSELTQGAEQSIVEEKKFVVDIVKGLGNSTEAVLANGLQLLNEKKRLLEVLNPREVLKRGYAVARSKSGKSIASVKGLRIKQTIDLELVDGTAAAEITGIKN